MNEHVKKGRTGTKEGEGIERGEYDVWYTEGENMKGKKSRSNTPEVKGTERRNVRRMEDMR